MTRQSNALGLLAAAAALGFWGCTDFPLPGPGNCSSDSSCATTEMCHPVLKTCVTSCTAGADCPQEAKTCAPLAGSAKSFCQCATDPLCANATAGNICMEATKQCASKCTATSGCPSGYDCATATGQCVKGTADTGPPADGGTGGVACTYRSCAGDKESCNLTTNRCQVVTCNANNAQPDTCGYARYCATDDGCYDLPEASCGNFASSGAYGGPKFNPASSTGPAIYYVEETADDAAFCFTTHRAFSFLVYAYRTDANWPSAVTGITGAFNYVNSSGTPVSAINSMRQTSGYTPNGRTATFKVTLCAPSATNTLTAGFVFTNGNEYCTEPASGTLGTVPPT